MLAHSVDYGGRTCFRVYATWTLLSLLACVLIPPLLDATHPGGEAQGLTSLTVLLPLVFYGYCAIAFFYLLKFGLRPTFRSVADLALVLLLAYLQYHFWYPTP